jgi:hypothetical protein
LFELRKWGRVNTLVQQVAAHGGIWRQLESVSAHLRTGGFLWPLKHHRILDAVNAHLRKERTYDN